MRIYLDVCCLNRPFDDQTQKRIHLESEAILVILEQCQRRVWELINSQAIENEIAHIPDSERRKRVEILSQLAHSKVEVNIEIEHRAEEFERLGFAPFDALHIACAESARAGIFLTTDDELSNRALRNNRILKVRVENPVKWLMEVLIK
ncbi:MAG: PIN domain-containing protein [Planctomycetota bacterium]